MLEKLSSLIKHTKTIPNSIEKEEQLTLNLIARYSNGNVNLQKGCFITKQEIIKKEKIIFSHSFI